MLKRLMWPALVLCLVAPSFAQLGSHFSVAEMGRLEAVTARVETTLARHGTLPGAREIYDAFRGKLQTTRFVAAGEGAYSIFVSRHDPSERIDQMLEVVVFDERNRFHPHIGGRPLFYDRSWRAVFIIDASFPDQAWFDAFVMHELVHAYHDRIGSSSAHAPAGSDLWVQEELEAHDLERAVLAAATNGAYERELRRIAATLQRTSTGGIMIASADYAALDVLFEEADTRELPFRRAQQSYDIASAWIESNFSVMEWWSRKQEAYRYLTQ